MSFSYNDHEESFANLHVYLHNIQRINPNSYTYIKTDVLDRFQLCFVAIRCVYLNSIFVAAAMDGNNNTTPIAFGIGVSNNVNSSTWFLIRLKDAIREGREVALITDMDDTISSYVGQVFRDAYMFFRACKAYTTQDFQQSFSKLSHATREFLANIGNKKWTQAYFLNINIPEFLLVLSVMQHNVPIISLIDTIVQYIQQTFAERRMLSTIFTPYVEMVLHRRMQKSLGWKATKISPEILLGIACGHAIAAARYTNNTELTDMVQIYYWADTTNVNVVPPTSEWEILEPLMVVLIPIMNSSHFVVWHCEEAYSYVYSDNNPTPEGPDFSLPDNMPDDIFQAIKAVEEANERDSQISRELNQHANELADEVIEKEKWVADTTIKSKRLSSGFVMQIRSFISFKQKGTV
uniref:Uncharacterized protein n=1 Tax=Lactuca sativa TaxID=4236 RepID=A0A9R1WWM0_LACSA|nr:hypothetical protein LSAT_V11C800450960 [Lactuca sativa]